jgi:SAM-dependent methyltransferase
MMIRIHESANGFQTASEAYERGRPSYPAEAVRKLIEELGIQAGRTVIELGSGTGKFTKQLVPTGATVIAVEPVEGMRHKFSEIFPDVQVLAGKAEAIPVADGSADAVIAAQAFHWFDGPITLREIHRVLKSSGRLGLIWNVRDESVDWVHRLTDIIEPHAKGTPRHRTGAWKKAFQETALFTPLQLARFRYDHAGPPEMIVDRVRSTSFISTLPSATREGVLNQVRELVKAHPLTQGKSTLAFPYCTEVYWCERC